MSDQEFSNQSEFGPETEQEFPLLHPKHAQAFEYLLQYIKRTRGFDFTGYKRTSLMRRVLRRIQTTEAEDFVGYMDYLEVHQDEFATLFNTILINVTSFFRDAPAWTYLADEIIPRILDSKQPHEPIRIWSAGCASGEEAYTLAMLFAEAMSPNDYRERVKIYATDADEEALTEARQAAYGAKQVAPIPPEYLEKYFEFVGQRHVVNKDIRRSVIFGRHDLTRDAPISHIDLLVCRNALMYFNAEAQARIILRFHFALNNGGVFFLGKAEMLSAHGALFTPFELQRRIFLKVPRDRLLSAPLSFPQQNVPDTDAPRGLRDIVFETGPVPEIVVDAHRQVVQINERARALFRLSLLDVGRPLQDLEVSYRPADLRSLIDRAFAERRAVSAKEIEWKTSPEGAHFYDVMVAPLTDSGTTFLGATVTFTDVTRYRQLQDELQESSRELETAYEELQSTNEELETAYEELQSTNEELETTNEELQSTNEELETTNEELETMNEELQATNDELQEINDELRDRSGELDQSNGFLEAVFASLRASVIVLDGELRVKTWNRGSEELWGLRAEEVKDKHFMNLDIGLPVERLRQPLRACLADENHHEEIRLNAVNRRGKTIRCRIVCSAILHVPEDGHGVMLFTEEDESGEATVGAAESPS